MTISYWLDHTQTPKPAIDCDFLIVGAGIAGLSLAYWLERAYPDARVLILERYTPGSGASARNAGFLTCGSIEHFARLSEQHGHQKAVQIWKFSEMNRELLKEHVIQDGAENVEFRQTGTATVAKEKNQLARFRATANLMVGAQLPVQELLPGEIKESYGLKNYAGGFIYQEDGQIHPGKLLRRIRSKLRAEVKELQEAFRLTEEGLVETASHHYKAQHTFLTLNAYLPLLAPEFSKFILPNRGQILVTKPVHPRIKGPVYITHELAYMRQLAQGEILIGGFRKRAPEIEETYTDSINPLVQEALATYLQEHFGAIEVDYRWSGVMGFSPDGQMLIGPHPRRKKMSLMAGCSGHGMGLSFHCAKVLAESYAGKAIPEHLDVRRFNI